SSLSSTADSTLPHLESPTVPSKVTSFRFATADEISRLINQAPNKQCNLDPIPMSLLKQCCRILAPVITNIVNLSLSTGEFPSQFKQAIVTPLIKKPSLDKESLSVTTGQSRIFPLSQNLLSVSSRTAFMNT